VFLLEGPATYFTFEWLQQLVMQPYVIPQLVDRLEDLVAFGAGKPLTKVNAMLYCLVFLPIGELDLHWQTSYMEPISCLQCRFCLRACVHASVLCVHSQKQIVIAYTTGCGTYIMTQRLLYFDSSTRCVTFLKTDHFGHSCILLLGTQTSAAVTHSVMF